MAADVTSDREINFDVIPLATKTSKHQEHIETLSSCLRALVPKLLNLVKLHISRFESLACQYAFLGVGIHGRMNPIGLHSWKDCSQSNND